MRVIVIGGGVVGASAAYHLTRRGVSTTLVDRFDPGAATPAGAGVVFPWPFPGSSAAEAAFRRAAAAHYPRLMADLADDDCGPTGYAVVGGVSVGADAAALRAEAEAMAAMAALPGHEGMGEVAFLPPGEPARRMPVLRAEYAGVAVPGTARVDGRLTRAALVGAAEERALRRRAGDAGLVTDGTRVTGVRVGGDELSADAVVVAAGAWSPGLLEPLGVRLGVRPVRGQLLHLRLPRSDTSAWPVVRAGEREHYLLAFAPDRIVAGSTREPGAGFEARTTAGAAHRLLTDALATAPGLAAAGVVEARVGLRPEGVDGAQLLGVVDSLPGLVVATGLGSEGLTLGPYQGAVAARLAMGEDPGLDLEPFRPDRFTETAHDPL
ncbi:NAD(P)/FAD-dependent oxidoreductase [Actinorugispora endophytica]|uniref:D-amino-acid dehydrogenase n=1 Tax=Actinorugispora endophytica TaxID=1605990 RepID=A0A4R6UNV6_9ACTN|nr:FAD-binding oxidoreductase [Actinorugispora endophytica]TDQ47183.1 D-amino-acid dehydrogenase [Actinorugispora endophytica]